LEHFERAGDVITISGANLHVTNGLGSADTTNGLGNVIIGYNESRGGDDERTGSHNLVLGKQNNFSSYGGIIAGQVGAIAAPGACVLGGFENIANGDFSVVTGGLENTASGPWSIVTGGKLNNASGDGAVVTGGRTNTAAGTTSVVSGGESRTSNGQFDWVAGSLWEDQ